MRHVTAVIAALLHAAFPPHADRRIAAGATHKSAPIVPAASPRVPTAHSAAEMTGRLRTRTIKARRVRRYARAAPVDFDASPAYGPEALDPVRPYVRLWEQKREAQRAETDLRGSAALTAAGGAR